MDDIDCTPELALRLYENLRQRLAIVRRRARRPLTLADKLLLGHLDDPEAQDLRPAHGYLALRPDRVVFQDVLGQSAMLQFLQTGRTKVAVPTSVHCDHLIQARSEGAADLRASLAENHEVYAFLRAAAAKFGAGFWGPGAGIIHQVVLENYALPGTLIIGTDSHTPNAGGLGACAIGVGGADAVEVISGLPWELAYPRRIAVFLSGQLGGWTAPKDVILFVAGALGTSGGTHSVVEYIGPGARTLSATGKATIANMGAEIGATTSIFPADQHMLAYLSATGRGALVPWVEQNLELCAPDPEAESDPEAHYDRVLRLDLSRLEPHVAGPHSPDRARPISVFAAELRDAGRQIPDALGAALIGSCTNSSYEDMSRAADVARQAEHHGLQAAAPLLVAPGSERVRRTIERDGQLQALERIGGVVLASACGPCIGQWRRPDRAGATPESIVSSFNRNFPGRNDGRTTTLHFIASPEIVMALALAGRLSFNPLTDTLTGNDGRPFRLEPPAPAPEVPALGFEAGRTSYVSPPRDGSHVILPFDPESERLQRLEPWPAWDGLDLLDLPVLAKTRGKTTTDQISPAGPWLRFRGHLDRFSDNLLSGAVNAFTGDVGKGRDGRTFSAIARDYRASGRRWVIVGDANYGEGSSREHAALSPRLLNGAAVIAKSFARIHEMNLKKHGLLALTFADAADYDRIGERDLLSLVDLPALEPGKPVRCLVLHEDGTREELRLEHSYSASQLTWFRAGSALNLCRAR
jgi:aconitate hydratase